MGICDYFGNMLNVVLITNDLNFALVISMVAVSCQMYWIFMLKPYLLLILSIYVILWVNQTACTEFCFVCWVYEVVVMSYIRNNSREQRGRGGNQDYFVYPMSWSRIEQKQ